MPTPHRRTKVDALLEANDIYDLDDLRLFHSEFGLETILSKLNALKIRMALSRDFKELPKTTTGKIRKNLLRERVGDLA